MLSIAFSPCPNDIFIFAGWWKGAIKTDFALDVHLADIQKLNEAARQRAYPLLKLSATCLADLQDSYRLLPVGAALGYNFGPKLISLQAKSLQEISQMRIAIPGQHTTAHSLLKILLPMPKEKIYCSYDQIMPLLQAGTVDAGIIIHESRFIFEEAGFHEIADLGLLWQGRTGLPLPLGCLAASKELEPVIIEHIIIAVQDSIAWARNNPDLAMRYALEYAQVKDPEVVKKHIELYVTKESEALSETGFNAFKTLFTLHGENARDPLCHPA